VYRLKFSKLYDTDVDSSYNYITNNLQAPMAAGNLIKETILKLEKIKENPKIRPLVHDKYLAALGYRSMKVKNYLIFYIIVDDNKTVKIVRFLYGKRNWINLLKEENIKEKM
jgi:toxin ParE1/3/4